MPATARCSKPAARSGFWSIPPLEPYESFYVGTKAKGGTSSSITSRPSTGSGRRSSSSRLRCRWAASAWSRQEVAFMQQGRADVRARTRCSLDAEVHRPRGPGHAAGRGLAARRDELPDAAGLGHGLHADLQHDRAAVAADAGRPRRDRLVRARNRVPLRAAAGRRHLRRSSTMPIGQVFFVPREEITMRDCTAEELEAMRRRRTTSSAARRRPHRSRRRTAFRTARTT